MVQLGHLGSGYWDQATEKEQGEKGLSSLLGNSDTSTLSLPELHVSVLRKVTRLVDASLDVPA